ncbi:MAG: 4Fe-4S binding protein [Planctomycetes bacterium]|nr:4Fe-4S binding protein [Planctomycetota bacterium]
MKELVIISGKGGTGKTSLVACFAALAKKKVLADCDVDAADLHLLLEPRILKRAPFQAGREAIIREADCNGCGLCQKYCRFKAISNLENKFTIDPTACEGCGVCVYFCPQKAIDFPEKTCGEWFISDTRHGPMVHAKLGIAEENSGKLVSLVRSQAKTIAQEQGLDLVIIDGSPGIGCPVIASLTGASVVLVVTEPTQSGLHDLERVAKLSSHFKIPALACINKYDINPEMTEKITRFCEQAGLQVVGRIPYDPLVTKAQLSRQSVVEFGDTPAAVEIRQLWQHLSDLLV